MPTYQYRCTECGQDLEAVQKFTDPALTECPNCSGTLRKVFNAVGVVFKGSGFYRTDSRAGDKNGRSADASDGGAGPGKVGAESGGDKSGSTPAADKSGSKPGSEKVGSNGAAGKSGADSPAGAGSGSKGSTKQPAKAGSSTTNG